MIINNNSPTFSLLSSTSLKSEFPFDVAASITSDSSFWRPSWGRLKNSIKNHNIGHWNGKKSLLNIQWFQWLHNVPITYIMIERAFLLCYSYKKVPPIFIKKFPLFFFLGGEEGLTCAFLWLRKILCVILYVNEYLPAVCLLSSILSAVYKCNRNRFDFSGCSSDWDRNLHRTKKCGQFWLLV
jgi:hypothetical protein